MKNLRKELAISRKRLDEINQLLADPKNPLVNGLLEIVKRYGGPEKINRQADEARQWIILCSGSSSKTHPMWPT